MYVEYSTRNLEIIADLSANVPRLLPSMPSGDPLMIMSPEASCASVGCAHVSQASDPVPCSVDSASMDPNARCSDLEDYSSCHPCPRAASK